MATALISALTQRAARRDVAMTGEITLRGRVLPIGGLKEKVLAAHRAGIKTFILPKRNMKDLNEVPPEIMKELRFVPVERMDDVIAAALHTLPFAQGDGEKSERGPMSIKPVKVKRAPAPRPATRSAGTV